MNDLKKFQVIQRGLVSIQARVASGEIHDHGICSYFDSIINRMDNLTYRETSQAHLGMVKLMMQWPEYSGCDLYIIGQNPTDARRLYIYGEYIRPDLHGAEWHWSMKSPYGRKRRELLAWLINRCEEITGQVL